MNYWQIHIFLPWAVIYALLGLAFCAWAAARISWVIFPILSICTLSGVYQSAYLYNPWNGVFDVTTFILLGKYALLSMLAVMLSAWALAVTPRGYGLFAEWGLAMVGATSAGLTLVQRFYHMVPGGFVGNPSMNGCLIAALTPFFFQKPMRFGLPLLLIGVACTGGSQPLGILCVVGVVYLYRRLGTFDGVVWTMIGAVPLITAYTWLPYDMPHPLLDSNGRFPVYFWVWDWWASHCSEIFGAGLGSGSQLIQYVQRINEQYTNLFPWLHSDWLQIGFELGYAGLASAIIAFIWLMGRAWDRPEIVTSLIAFGAMMVFNWPLHAPVHAMCMVLLTYLILREPDPLQIRPSPGFGPGSLD